MSISGYKHTCGKRSGGIKSIALIEAQDIVEIDYSFENDCFDNIVPKSGKGFYVYEFKEGDAIYKEEIQTSDGIATILHHLEFSIERIDATSISVVDKLISASKNGLIAVITTSNNVSILVGYSRRFEFERPLLVTKTNASSGYVLGDDTKEKVVLQSEDVSKSKVFTGTIALLK